MKLIKYYVYTAARLAKVLLGNLAHLSCRHLLYFYNLLASVAASTRSRNVPILTTVWNDNLKLLTNKNKTVENQDEKGYLLQMFSADSLPYGYLRLPVPSSASLQSAPMCCHDRKDATSQWPITWVLDLFSSHGNSCSNQRSRCSVRPEKTHWSVNRCEDIHLELTLALDGSPTLGENSRWRNQWLFT